jgi:aspartate carbamoyltransferase catalytic subunit
MRTPLHTTPTQLKNFATQAHNQLDRIATLVARLAESNQCVELVYPDEIARDGLLTERLEEKSWMTIEYQHLADLVYLLAVGDTGPSRAAEQDPERRSRQAHYQRRQDALERLSEDGIVVHPVPFR